MRCRLGLSLALLLLGGAAPLAAATPHLVKDIDPVPQPESSSPYNFENVLPGFSFFTANDGETGDELWRTDGTAGGTFRLTDACPGECPSRPFFLGRSDRLYFFQVTGTSRQELWATDGSPGGTFFLTQAVQFAGFGTWVASQRLLYFAADDGIHGAELWRTDGTPAGTFLVTDLWPGPGGASLSELTDLNGKLYFRADDGRGPSLWTSDGTPQGTRLVKNLSPSSNRPDPSLFSIVMGRTLYFTAPTPKHGVQLWRSDGTAKGTSSFTSFKPQPDSSPFSEFAVLGNRLFFVAETKGPGRQLWVTDGTAKGTRTLTNFPPRSRPLSISTFFGNRLVFAGDDGPHGFELWTTDGTPRGTSLLKDLCPGPCSGATGEAIQAGNFLYLAGTDGVHGQEPWVSNGTAAGTRLIADLCAGSCDSVPSGIRPAGGLVYFVATDGTNGRQVWRSDSTAQGTFPLTTDFSRFAFAKTIEGFVQGSTLVFTTSDAESGRELWRSDGTPQGTGLLADLNPSDAGGSDPIGLTPLGDKLYFLAKSNGETGLWTSDGTGAGTVQLPPLPLNHGLSSELAGVSGTIFFIVALQEEPSASLWRTYGVNSNLRLTPPALKVQVQMKAVGNLVFFEATDDDHGEELWVTDGSVTHLVADIQPGLLGSHPGDFTPSEGRLYFTVINFDLNRRQLWRSDGTEAGTALVQEAVSNPTSMTVHGGRLWFFAQDAEGESHLWSTDGTSGGTRIEPLLPGPGSVTGGPMFWDGNRVFFSGAAADLESGLYVWDGTPGSLRHLGEVVITESFFNPVPGVVSNGVLYFSGHDRSFQENLWVSDGTEAGTRQVLDASGNPISEPHYFQTLAGGVYFTNQDSLFRTDGTAAGTQSLALLFAPGESGFHELVAAGPRLFFRKWDRATGTELWALEAN